jgi:hypothetical protein
VTAYILATLADNDVADGPPARAGGGWNSGNGSGSFQMPAAVRSAGGPRVADYGMAGSAESRRRAARCPIQLDASLQLD